MEQNVTELGQKTKTKQLVLEAPTVRVYARGINIQALTFVRVSVYGRRPFVAHIHPIRIDYRGAQVPPSYCFCRLILAARGRGVLSFCGVVCTCSLMYS